MNVLSHFTSISKSQPPAARTKSLTSSISDGNGCAITVIMQEKPEKCEVCITLTDEKKSGIIFSKLGDDNKSMLFKGRKRCWIMYETVKVMQTSHFSGFSCIMTVIAQPFPSDSYRFFSCIYIYTCYLMQFLQKIAFPITKTSIF